MNVLAEAVESVAQGSRNRTNSLAPSTPGGSPRQGTPQGRRRARRSGSQAGQARHEVSDEEPPPDAFHSPAFQQGFGDAKRLMSDMETVLGSSTLHTDNGSTVGRLHQEAGELASFRYPSTRIVGFVGDSGAGRSCSCSFGPLTHRILGKSSLLNSLLDMRGLARTVGSEPRVSRQYY